MKDEDTGRVWASTWVPAPCPLEGFGSEGYAVCWVDVAGSGRLQALVEGSAPEPGCVGRVRYSTFGAIEMAVFRADPS